MRLQLPAQFGNYTLLQLVARGGMAEVFRAQMNSGIDGFGKMVAIKKILPNLSSNQDFITMLIDEARISVSLNHHNIAQVYDLGSVDGSYYIAMEYIPGVDLSHIIKKLAKKGFLLPLEHALFITKELCAGLYAAHTQKDANGKLIGIVHRDVSPHNLLISYNGEVKIIDFGVAKAEGKLGQTRMGVIKGKLLYMAPEQAMARPIDARADVFACGLCLYKMLTGRLPFEADNEFQIYNNILTGEIVPPKSLNPDLPDGVDDIVMKSLQRDLNSRYQDAWAMHQDLEKLLHQFYPGYTGYRLSRFLEEYFEEDRPKALDPSMASQPSSPSQLSAQQPSMPSRPSQVSQPSQPSQASQLSRPSQVGQPRPPSAQVSQPRPPQASQQAQAAQRPPRQAQQQQQRQQQQQPARPVRTAQPNSGSYPGAASSSYPGPQAGSYPGPQAGSYPGPQAGSYPGRQANSYPGPQASPHTPSGGHHVTPPGGGQWAGQPQSPVAVGQNPQPGAQRGRGPLSNPQPGAQRGRGPMAQAQRQPQGQAPRQQGHPGHAASQGVPAQQRGRGPLNTPRGPRASSPSNPQPRRRGPMSQSAMAQQVPRPNAQAQQQQQQYQQQHTPRPQPVAQQPASVPARLANLPSPEELGFMRGSDDSGSDDATVDMKFDPSMFQGHVSVNLAGGGSEDGEEEATMAMSLPPEILQQAANAHAHQHATTKSNNKIDTPTKTKAATPKKPLDRRIVLVVLGGVLFFVIVLALIYFLVL